MVIALQQLTHIEDKNLLCGHLCLLYGDYTRAQELFLSSSQPMQALIMRKNLLQWEQALKLAQTLSVEDIPEVCVQYGQQLEFRDDSEHALGMYESALSSNESKSESKCSPELMAVARVGIARYPHIDRASPCNFS